MGLSRAGVDSIQKADESAGREWVAQPAPPRWAVLLRIPLVVLCWSGGWPAHPAVHCLAAYPGSSPELMPEDDLLETAHGVLTTGSELSP